MPPTTEHLFDHWKKDLALLLEWLKKKKSELNHFYGRLFFFFFVLNFSCYWLGLLFIFPGHVFSHSFFHYAKISLPVGFMGALFDSLSFYVTLWIIEHAIHTRHLLSYISHLFMDFIIAILATFWVLFVFVISGYLVNKMDGKAYKTRADGTMYVVKADEKSKAELLGKRKEAYRARVEEAMRNPSKNLRNILFGIIMGLSAMLPTCIHLSMFFRLLFKQKPI